MHKSTTPVWHDFCELVAICSALVCAILFCLLPFLGAFADDLPAVVFDSYVAGLGSSFLGAIVFGVISLGEA
jgi:hypothetical protein